MSRRAEPKEPGLGAEHSVVVAASLLAGLGLVMVYSITAPLALETRLPPHFARHALALAAGGLLAFAASRAPLRLWWVAAPPLWLLALAALGWTALDGLRVNGAQRWLVLPGVGVSVQPAELAKFAAVLAAAALLSRRPGRSPVPPGHFVATLGLAAAPALLLLLQPDLGNAVLLLALIGALLFATGAPLRALLWPVGVLAAGVVAYVGTHAYAYDRVTGFLRPWATSQAEGFQLVQSFVAFGRGGVLGAGWGYGRQKLHYLPEAHTDFVLSVVAEELGLVGVLVVLAAFAALLVAGLRIALRARGRFAMVLAFGMTLLLTLPAVLNAAVVMGLLPTKGLTLPFLSYGRSSLLVCCLAVGVLLGVARAGRQPETSGLGGTP